MDTLERRARLIESNTEELLTHDELIALLRSGTALRHYIGFEISGLVHLGSGLVCMAKVKDFVDAGAQCNVLLADWHTWINDKLGGDREVIRRVATGYFPHALRAGLRCVGADPDTVNFVLASDLYRHNDEYWATVIDVAKHTSLARMQRSISILGRQEGESVDFAKLIYPAMQAADIFALHVNLAHAGIDQRKAHVIARDVAPQMRINRLVDAAGQEIKPLAVHHPLILGLSKPPVWPVPAEGRRELLTAMKMSKSDPRSAVFIHDDPDTIRAKVSSAFCPPRDTFFNPVLDWFRRLVFELGVSEVRLNRSERHGGDVTLHSYEELEAMFESGALHPMDAKAALAEQLIERLAPARSQFATPEGKAMLEDVRALIA